MMSTLFLSSDVLPDTTVSPSKLSSIHYNRTSHVSTDSTPTDEPSKSSKPTGVSSTTIKDEEPSKSTGFPEALGLGNHGKEATKWKIGFAVCIALVVILLAGKLLCLETKH